jgi:hypothetical protein
MVHKVLKIIKEEQGRSNWCYSAVLTSLAYYYTNKYYGQAAICSYYGEMNGSNVGNEKQDPYDFLITQGMFKDSMKLENTPIPYDLVVSEINNGNPIIMYVDNGHYVLIYGYSGEMPTGRRTVANPANQLKYLIYDPVDPREDTFMNYLDTTFRTEYEPGKGATPLSINGIYLTKSPLDGGRKSKKRNHRKSKKRNHRKSKKHNHRKSKKQNRQTIKRHKQF